MRPLMLLLGIGVAAVWLLGLDRGATAWMVWIDLAAALASIASAGLPPRDGEPTEAALAVPFVLAGTLMMVWLLGLALRAPRWLAWSNFAFGLAYGLLGVAVGMLVGERGRMQPRNP